MGPPPLYTTPGRTLCTPLLRESKLTRLLDFDYPDWLATYLQIAYDYCSDESLIGSVCKWTSIAFPLEAAKYKVLLYQQLPRFCDATVHCSFLIMFQRRI